PAFAVLRDCLRMTALMLSNIRVNDGILNDEKYKYLFSVEEVNKLVLQGVPFRDAYKKVGESIEQGRFNHSTNLHHTHEGSIGNLCNSEIKRMMSEQLKKFNFEKATTALSKLLQ
ncbi:MAG: argininosuccinate lyase, partial [Cyclobacteriaceae bacterium]|nr:argininosuccinate lyase [Cyclobacteriaceae bacterium]